MPRNLRKILGNIGMLTACVVLLSMARCTTRVIPPVRPQQPTTIYLCNYGIHSSLLLPLHDGRFVEYLYGDWNWAVLNQKGTFDGPRAILFSNQAALGRRYLTCAPDEKIPMPPEQPNLVGLKVSDACVQEVICQLDHRFARQNSYMFQQAMSDGGYIYVKDSIHYSVLHDCNCNTAEELQKMGCTTVGWPVWSDFSVEKEVGW